MNDTSRSAPSAGPDRGSLPSTQPGKRFVIGFVFVLAILAAFAMPFYGKVVEAALWTGSAFRMLCGF